MGRDLEEEEEMMRLVARGLDIGVEVEEVVVKRIRSTVACTPTVRLGLESTSRVKYAEEAE